MTKPGTRVIEGCLFLPDLIEGATNDFVEDVLRLSSAMMSSLEFLPRSPAWRPSPGESVFETC